MRVRTGETGASSFFGVAVRVVVPVRPCDIEDGHGEGMLVCLGVGIRGVVELLMSGNIAACGRSTSNVREEECEDERSEVDHCENAGCKKSIGWRGVKSDENPKERCAHSSYIQIKAGILLGRAFLCPETHQNEPYSATRQSHQHHGLDSLI